MKSKIAINLLICLIAPVTLPAADGPDVPSITARTDNVGRKTVKSGMGTTSREEQDIRTLGVRVQLRSFAIPKQPYDVQCFFIARSQSTKSNYIYDVQRQQSAGQEGVHQFQAPAITGTSRKWVALPVSGTYTGTSSTGGMDRGTFTGSATYSQSVPGSKFYGWLIRVVSQGKVVRIETNQAPLKALAEANPAMFDAAIKAP